MRITVQTLRPVGQLRQRFSEGGNVALSTAFAFSFSTPFGLRQHCELVLGSRANNVNRAQNEKKNLQLLLGPNLHLLMNRLHASSSQADLEPGFFSTSYEL